MPAWKLGKINRRSSWYIKNRIRSLERKISKSLNLTVSQYRMLDHLGYLDEYLDRENPNSHWYDGDTDFEWYGSTVDDELLA